MVRLIRKNFCIEQRQWDSLKRIATPREKVSELVRKGIDMILEARSKKD
jgi:hypothetical protein